VLPVPFTIAQLSDPHLGASWERDPEAALTAALEQLQRTLGRPPHAVILTGDIANTPNDAEYRQARRVLAGVTAPLYLLAGNHDDREGLRRHFALPASPAEHLSYVADLGPVRLVVLDSHSPGEIGGKLDGLRLEWLDRVLEADPATPTLLAVHHPPIATGVPAMDAIGIPPAQRHDLETLLARHRQVQLIVCGHVHRAVIGELGATRVVAIPSTGLQLALDLDVDELRFVDEPPCLAIHLLVEGRLVSHLQPIALGSGPDQSAP
jgi:3',5'-cyclic-AMP phosphodiesterase